MKTERNYTIDGVYAKLNNAPLCDTLEEALEHSIQKWRTMAFLLEKGYNISNDGISSCALCRMFYRNTLCTGCPIKTATGYSHCSGTPWARYKDGITSQATIVAAKEFVSFLEGLRKTKKKDVIDEAMENFVESFVPCKGDLFSLTKRQMGFPGFDLPLEQFNLNLENARKLVDFADAFRLDAYTLHDRKEGDRLRFYLKFPR